MTTTYGSGATITVLLDVDKNTVAFKKNEKQVVGSPRKIVHEAYYFAFSARRDDAVTILSMK